MIANIFSIAARATLLATILSLGLVHRPSAGDNIEMKAGGILQDRSDDQTLARAGG